MPAAQPSRSRTIRRRLGRLAIAGLVVAALLGALYALRGPLFGRLLADRIAAELSVATGADVTIGNVSGRWLSDLTLHDVAGVANRPGTLREFSAERVTAQFRLRDVLDDAVAGIDSIDVAGLDVTLDTDSVSGPPSATPIADAARALGAGLPPAHAAGRLHVISGAGRLDAAFDVTASQTGLIHAQITDQTVTLPTGETHAPPTIGAVWRIGVSPETNGRLALTADLPAVTGGLVLADGALPIGELRLAGGTVEIGPDDDSGKPTIRVIGVDLGQIDDLLRQFVGPLVGARPPDGAIPHAALSATVSVDGGRITGRAVELRFDRTSESRSGWGGVPLSVIEIGSIRWDDGRVDVERLVASAGSAGGSLDVSTVTLHTDDARGTLGVEGAALEYSDLRRLLAVLGVADGTEVLDRLDGPVHVNVQFAREAGGDLRIGEARVSTDRSSVTLRGTVRPPAAGWAADEFTVTLDVEAGLDTEEVARLAPDDAALPAFRGRVHAKGSLQGRLGAMTGAGELRADELGLDDRLVREVRLEVAYDGSLLSVAACRLTTDFGRVIASGDVDMEAGIARDVAFELDAPDLAVVGRLFPALPELAGSLRITGTATGRVRAALDAADDPVARWPDDLFALVSVSGDGVVIDGAALGRIEAAAQVEGAVVDVERLQADGPLGRVRLAGRADIRTGAVDVPGFALSINDVARLSRWWPALEDVTAGGDLDGTLVRKAGVPWRLAHAAVTLRAPRAVIGGNELTDVTVEGRTRDGHVEASRIRATTPWGVVDMAGTAELPDDEEDAAGTTAAAATARLTRLDVGLAPGLLGRTGAPIPVRLAGPCTIGWTDDAVTIDGLDAAAFGGRVRGSGRWSGDLALDLACTGIDADVFLPETVGLCDAEVTVRGDPRRPDAAVRLRAPTLRWRAHVGALDVDVRQDVTGLHIDRLHVDAGALLTVEGSGRAPVRFGADGPEETAGPPASLRLTVKCADPTAWLARFQDTREWTAGRITADVRAEGGALLATVSADAVAWTPADSDGGPGVRIAGVTTLAVEAGPDDVAVRVSGGDGTLRIAGEFRAAARADWRRPADALDALRTAPLTGTLRVDSTDLEPIAAWVDGLHHLSGEVHADVQVAGTATAPTWTGLLEARKLTVRLEGDVPAIDRGRAKLRFVDGRRCHVDEIVGRLGYSPFRASGQVWLDDAGDVRMDVAAAGENLQLVRSRDARVRADLDLRLRGLYRSLAVTGTANVTDALISAPMTVSGGSSASTSDSAFQLFALRDAPLSGMHFDVRVIADHTIRVDNDLLRGDAAVDIVLRGTGAVPEPEGRVDFRDTLVLLPLTRMRVDTGSVVFAPRAPFEPQIRATAFTRLKGYDLEVQVTGPVADLRVQVSSSPPLSQEDALLLLATGAAPADVARDGVTRIAVASAGTLLGEAVLAWFTGPREAGEESLLDRVTVDVGRDRSESGTATIEAELELAERWFLRLERDRWDAYDAGVLWRVRFR